MRFLGHTQVLERGDPLEVRFCGCGVVHVTAGAATINLTQEAFHELAAMMEDVSEELRRGPQLKPSQPEKPPAQASQLEFRMPEDPFLASNLIVAIDRFGRSKSPSNPRRDG